MERGTCGENLTWTLDNGTLTISGAGAMENYTWTKKATWSSQRNLIKKVVIEDGVTSIGEFAFSYCVNLKGIKIPNNVTKIGYLAFSGCICLEEIKIPSNITRFDEGIFEDCIKLKKIYYPASFDFGGKLSDEGSNAELIPY